MVKRRWRGLAYALIVVAAIVLFLYWQNNSLSISRYVLSFEKLPKGFDGYRIVQISDMHGKTFGYQNTTLAKTVNELKPDVLLVTGDMLSSTVNDGGAFLNFLDHIDKTYPIYMCLGNHEQIVRWINSNGNMTIDYKEFIKNIEARGVKLLDNEKVTLEHGGDTISLEGLTLELYHYSRRDLQNNDDNLLLKEAYIEQVLDKPAKGFNLLLAHNPAYFKQYEAWGADLVLSGHVHGGVIQVPFKGGLLSPEHVFFPEYDAGLFELEQSKMIVNRGLGSSQQVNFRLFNMPDISFIELKKAGG
ncbi:MAG: metallophosphoesterase [Clostridia bacterium]|nr:metallophosphoesterase [Clostridia bacterium]